MGMLRGPGDPGCYITGRVAGGRRHLTPEWGMGSLATIKTELGHLEVRE